MKNNFIFATLILTLLLVQNASAELTKLADNVYSYVGVKDASPAHSFAANAAIVVGRDSVLVIDTLISAKEGARFLADIRKVTNRPIKYVVNTHTHLDHALGNCVFAKLGATVISHDADRASLATQGADILKNASNYGLKPEDMVGTEIVVPTLSFSDQLTIDMGVEDVHLIRTAPSHTAGSLVVYLPTKKLLFSGDILFTDFHPFMADGDISVVIKASTSIKREGDTWWVDDPRAEQGTNSVKTTNGEAVTYGEAIPPVIHAIQSDADRYDAEGYDAERI